MNRKFDGTTGPREPVTITVGAARTVKNTKDQSRRTGTQSSNTGSDNQTPSTPRSATPSNTTRRASNTSRTSVELVSVPTGLESNRSRRPFYTAPSTPERRRDSGPSASRTTPKPTTTSVRPGIEIATENINLSPVSPAKKCDYCGNMFSNYTILKRLGHVIRKEWRKKKRKNESQKLKVCWRGVTEAIQEEQL